MRQMSLITALIAIIASTSTARDSTIVWKIQLRKFNPQLCCAINPTHYDSDMRYYKQLSDLDTSITKIKSPLRDSIRFAYLGSDESMNDTLLVKSNRDTCGLTYLIKRFNSESSGSIVFGIFTKPPKYSRQGKLVWDTSFDTLGVIGEISSAIDHGIYVFDPKSITIKSIRSSSSATKQQHLIAQKSAIDSNFKDLIKSFEHSARQDSINQINLACVDHSVTAYTGTCPNDKDNSGTITQNSANSIYVLKPMIYLYPDKITNYQITLDSSIPIAASYPKIIDNKWNVRAFPDGKIIDIKSGKEFYGLFWEGGNPSASNSDSGIIVKSENFSETLDSLLIIKGLNYREREEFVTFWISRTLNYKWIKIHFVDNEFSANNEINIHPSPIGFVRVSAIFTGLNHYRVIPPETIVPRHRHPNDAVEWGGVFIDGTETNR